MCIEIDDQLMERATRLSGLRTKKAVVEEALRFYVQMKKQERVLDRLWGVAKWEGDLEKSRLGRS